MLADELTLVIDQDCRQEIIRLTTRLLRQRDLQPDTERLRVLRKVIRGWTRDWFCVQRRLSADKGKLRCRYVPRAALMRFYYELRQANSIDVDLITDWSEMNGSKCIWPRGSGGPAQGRTRGV